MSQLVKSKLGGFLNLLLARSSGSSDDVKRVFFDISVFDFAKELDISYSQYESRSYTNLKRHYLDNLIRLLVKEIDLNIEYEEFRTERRVTEIRFHISSRDTFPKLMLQQLASNYATKH